MANRWQRTKINTAFSSWVKIQGGVPQGSILGPLLFNIFINDLFWLNEKTEILGWADDINTYACDQNLESLITRLEHDVLLVIEWFDSNYMKLNTKKCHLLISGCKNQWKWAMVGKEKIWENKSKTILGITIDRDLSFNDHVSQICLKAGRKVTALRRMCRYINLNKRKLIFNAFIKSQFAYCPLVWLFHDRKLENKINRLHERVLRIVYKDNQSTFKELLQKDKSVSIHHRNIQLLATEVYKHKHGLSPPIMNDVFEIKQYLGPILRSQSDYQIPEINTVSFGENSLRYLGPKIWNILPQKLKDIDSLNKFKIEIKTWIPSNCPCRICKVYISGIGFINTVRDMH